MHSSETARFDAWVHVGGEYHVYGLAWFSSSLSVLIYSDAHAPDWMPVGLFELDDAQPMPSYWEFAVRDRLAASGGDSFGKLVAIWGYPELVRNPEHNDGLVERETKHLKIFYAERKRREAEEEKAS
ncbi:MAG: hypothetical protein M3Y75_06605 [Actinomycetota bacterium]|nr:hypothetical protein [Actinomycetota bacterium]